MHHIPLTAKRTLLQSDNKNYLISFLKNISRRDIFVSQVPLTHLHSSLFERKEQKNYDPSKIIANLISILSEIPIPFLSLKKYYINSLRKTGIPSSTLDGDTTMYASRTEINGRPLLKQTEDYLNLLLCILASPIPQPHSR